MGKRKVDALPVPTGPRPDHSGQGATTERILNDIDALIEARITESERQTGELSVREVADTKSMTMPHARELLQKMVTDGLLTRRRCGKSVYYRAKA